jgi:hypothetical protein
VLAIASCKRELFEELFRQDAETSTLEACAPRSLSPLRLFF